VWGTYTVWARTLYGHVHCMGTYTVWARYDQQAGMCLQGPSMPCAKHWPTEALPPVGMHS